MVLVAQGVDDAALLCLDAQALLLLLDHGVDVFEGDDKLAAAVEALHHLELEVLDAAVAVHAVGEGIGVGVFQQLEDVGDAEHLVEERAVFLVDIALDVESDVVLVARAFEEGAKALDHDLAHAVTGGDAGLCVDEVDVLVGQRQRLDEALERGCLLLLCADVAQA